MDGRLKLPRRSPAILRDMFTRLPAQLLALSGLLFAACPPPDDGGLVLYVSSADEALAESFVTPIGDERVRVEVIDDPALGLTERVGAGLAVTRSDLPVEQYRLDGEGVHATVAASDVLGLQYGLADAFERFGYRFLHPQRTLLPPALRSSPQWPGAGPVPEVGLRGLHLHTLHPIEALSDFWLPSPRGLQDAERTIDWIVKNRGNYVQWTGLDDIARGGLDPESWRAHTQQILDWAHGRGVRVGLGVQLFGGANLQQAYDLIQAPGDEQADRAQLEEGLGRVVEGLDWDRISLSFGEFSGEEPETFIASVNLFHDVLTELAPGTGSHATIHVGNYDNLRVTWEGEEQLYYFLVQYADPAIVPWIHTVMYYNLFEDAGGAYLHNEFDDHRDFVLDRLAADLPIGYHPESAYWIAFDNSVPVWLPLYAASRVFDLQTIRDWSGKQVDEHVIFSSGWEWGYWLQDTVSLRASYQLQPWDDELRWTWDAIDGSGALSDLVVRVTDRQHQALIVDRLAPYLAGRDAAIDAADQGLGIRSQPDRPRFDEVEAMAEEERTVFVASFLEPLRTFADDLDNFAAEAESLAQALADPWVDEVRDGAAINAVRARYVATLYDAALARRDGRPGDDELAEAEALRLRGQGIVDRRGLALWDPEPETLLTLGDNPTIYDYGYLLHAADLCYWRREAAQAWEVVTGIDEAAPGCLFN